jgi:hypothetical protein
MDGMGDLLAMITRHPYMRARPDGRGHGSGYGSGSGFGHGSGYGSGSGFGHGDGATTRYLDTTDPTDTQETTT